jgi:hypothetical protein
VAIAGEVPAITRPERIIRIFPAIGIFLKRTRLEPIW